MRDTSLVPVEALKAMGADVETALEHVNVPSYVIDRVGIVRWMNQAARALVGDRVGRQFTSVVAPEDTRRARELFARKIVGNTEVTDASLIVLGPDGARVAVEISSVPLRHGEHVVGVFGQVSDVLEDPQPHPELHLTPRQAEVLRLLERGRSTTQIAEELQLSRETVRNHVRHLLHALGASSRLEAVAVARGDLVSAAGH
jgi:PAS domain S-box-containing protein